MYVRKFVNYRHYACILHIHLGVYVHNVYKYKRTFLFSCIFSATLLNLIKENSMQNQILVKYNFQNFQKLPILLWNGKHWKLMWKISCGYKFPYFTHLVQNQFFLLDMRFRSRMKSLSRRLCQMNIVIDCVRVAHNQWFSRLWISWIGFELHVLYYVLCIEK